LRESLRGDPYLSLRVCWPEYYRRRERERERERVTVGDDFGGKSYGEEEGPASLRGMREINKGKRTK
jgi:hypothetical protein